MSEENINENVENVETEAEAVAAETQTIEEKIKEMEAQLVADEGQQATESKIDDDTINKLVAQRVEEQLTKIKGSLDKAYAERDEAAKRLAAIEEKAKQEKMTKLTEEGKHKEVYEMKLAELNAKLEAATSRNVELARDMQVRDALRTVEFRNEKASKLAYDSIVSDLIQDTDTGEWLHKSGVGISEYVEVFQKDDENSFLLKPKTNSGAGSAAAAAKVAAANNKLSGKKPSEMSQAELLEAASQGLFGEVQTNLW